MSWLISPVADWWWDYECISGIIIDDCFWYPRGNHYSCRKIARKWAQHKSMRAHLQVNLVTRWANATKHLLSLCIYIISYLSSNFKPLCDCILCSRTGVFFFIFFFRCFDFSFLCRFLESKRRKELSALLRFGLRFTRCTRSGQLGITGKEFNAMLRIACRYLRHTLRLLAAAFRSFAKSSQCAVKPPVSYVLLL